MELAPPGGKGRLMRTSTKAIRLGAVVPAGLAGSFIAIVGLGFLPGAGLVLAFGLTLVVSIVLALGVGEALAARVFGFARGLRPGEQALLGPALQEAEQAGLAPRRVLVRLVDHDGAPVTPIGRRTVIVEPWLLQATYQRRLQARDVATVIGHAVASQMVGPARFDLSARVWAFPWTLVLAVLSRAARLLSWVPAGGLAWRLRIVVGIGAVYLGFQPGGSAALGIATGVLVAISYIAPAADRRWRSVVERDADRIVAERGLSAPLIHFAQWQQGSGSLERVHRIQSVTIARTGQNEPARMELVGA